VAPDGTAALPLTLANTELAGTADSEMVGLEETSPPPDRPDPAVIVAVFGMAPPAEVIWAGVQPSDPKVLPIVAQISCVPAAVEAGGRSPVGCALALKAIANTDAPAASPKR
jgi:hypothetical protein